jgi:hypothetical protein
LFRGATLGPLFHEDFFEVAAAIVAFGEVLGKGEEAEFRVLFDVGDGLGGVHGVFLPGEVERGDLEAVEEETGAAGIEFVRCEAKDHFGDGALDGGALVRAGEGKGEAAGFSAFRGLLAVFAGFELFLLDGLAGGVVEEAEDFLAERGTSAAMAAGEDVAALEADVGRGLSGHRLGAPTPGKTCKILRTLKLGPDLGAAMELRWSSDGAEVRQ